MADPVQCRRDADVLVITVGNPPVNAVGHAVRQGLLAAIERVRADAGIRAVVICGAGDIFIGGADIREFGQPRPPPLLGAVCDAIESLDKPVVAAVHGAALGGGMEVALAAHYRVADAAAEFGLPEVSLGLMPGAGGTQRTPRLVGAAMALDLMLTGRRLNASQAHRCGLVDRLVESPLAEAVEWARELAAAGVAARRSRDGRALSDVAVNRSAVEAALAEVESKFRGLFSPARIIEAVKAAVERPFDAGLALEAELFAECLQSPQRQGLMHAFKAEREVTKVLEGSDMAPRPVRSVGVIGGGTMGAGIAVALLDAGLLVTMVERDEGSLARGRGNVEKVYDGMVAKGRLAAEARADRLSRFTGATDYEPLAGVDLVIEAVFEEMTVKRAVFEQLERVCRPGVVLATNTSYLDVEALAAQTARPQDVIGLHFFSPAHVMKLLEIVVPRNVAADAVATGFALAKRLRKVAVRAGVCDGFIGNRMLAVYRRAAEYIVEDGASPYEVDAALRDFGFAMGPFQVSDLAGGDIGWATRKRRAATRPADERYVQTADRLCERGWFGQKSGRGWYLYPQGSRGGLPDPEVLAIIDDERRRAGVVARTFKPDEIVRRYVAAMINEGANVVHERIALRPLDVDVVLVNGYGFPRHRGGPMFLADQLGLPNLLASMREWSREDARFWQPSPLLQDLAERGVGFDSQNKPESSRASSSPGAEALNA